MSPARSKVNIDHTLGLGLRDRVCGFVKVAAMLGLCAFSVAPAAAKDPICLNLADIASSQPNREGTSITFVMRNGKVWRSDLGKACPDLGMNGFSWLSDAGRVCENAQMIHVLNSGEICRLGLLKPGPVLPRR